MTEIQLGGRKGSRIAGHALVDDTDSELAALNWHLWGQHGYAIRKDSKLRTVFMHRVCIERQLGRELSSNEVIHHKNGDRLDNRRSNLVLTNRSEHAALHGGFIGGARPHREKRRERGTQRRPSGRWQAFSRGQYIGTFNNQEEAIKAREKVEREAA